MRPAIRMTRPVAPAFGGLGGEPQHRLVEAVIADGELGGVDPDRQAAGPGIEIIAGECLLAALVEPPVVVEGEGMGGDHRAVAQPGQKGFGNLCAMQRHVGVRPSP
jgi:hypothetical protein